ncbi:SKA1 protein, partial [Ramphastos sulfuratus]|nr:SKA1 protein [Ramphastos sulfuratus]
MASPDLDSLCHHINTKISSVKRILLLRTIGQKPALKAVLCKIGKEIVVLHGLLRQMEMEVQHQEDLRDRLKELQKSAEKDEREAQHLRENIPQLPKPAKIWYVVPEHEGHYAKPQQPSKPTRKKRDIKRVGFITTEEFKNVPAYMRGRITCEQINNTVNEINKAVECKYKILHQPLKSMNAATRNLYHRFQEDETKETKG